MTRKSDVLRATDDSARALAHRLLDTAAWAALAVLEPASGHPLVSRVAATPDEDGAPLMLLSALSAHTPALEADGRCSLLLGEAGAGDPLAHPRITLIGTARRLERDSPEGQRVRLRYLSARPEAALYADFGDFAFWRIEPERASLVGGFGKAYALTRADLMR